MTTAPMNHLQASKKHSVLKKPFSLVYLSSLASLSTLAIVIPNSLQAAMAALLMICAALSIAQISTNDLSVKYIKIIYMCVTITILYLGVGVLNGAPDEAIKQVFVIYIISPILWFIVSTAAIKILKEDRLIELLVPVTLACCISVAVFFYLFNNYGPSSVSFFKENANVNLTDGYSGATMHVYGSLIFLTGAFFSASEAIKNKKLRLVMLGALTICAVTSGRSALILAAPLGLVLSIALSSRNKFKQTVKIKSLFLIGMSSVVGLWAISSLWGIDVYMIIGKFTEEILSGGGSERSTQTIALLDGALSSYGIGSGHGVGVDYVRSNEFPWRYESIWFATLHRTGLIGVIIYSLPFLIYVLSTLRKAIKIGLCYKERFFFGGFICALAASNTNPYMEAVSFQWMYVLPVVAFFMRKQNIRT